MKILNYGSMNIDNVYQGWEHMIRPGETQMAIAKNVFAGGKGLNQSIAIAKAGGTVYHAGVVGERRHPDGYAGKKHGVDTRHVKHAAGPSGHTVIQVDSSGQKQHHRLAGENMRVLDEDIERVLSELIKATLLILQNELDHRLPSCAWLPERGMTMIFNPSPVKQFAEQLSARMRRLVSAQRNRRQRALTQQTEPKRIPRSAESTLSQRSIVLTLGEDGAYCMRGDEILSARLSGSAGRYHRRRRYPYGLFRHRAFPRRRFIQGDGASRQGCRYRCKAAPGAAEHSLMLMRCNPPKTSSAVSCDDLRHSPIHQKAQLRKRL